MIININLNNINKKKYIKNILNFINMILIKLNYQTIKNKIKSIYNYEIDNFQKFQKSPIPK